MCVNGIQHWFPGVSGDAPPQRLRPCCLVDCPTALGFRVFQDGTGCQEAELRSGSIEGTLGFKP